MPSGAKAERLLGWVPAEDWRKGGDGLFPPATVPQVPCHTAMSHCPATPSTASPRRQSDIATGVYGGHLAGGGGRAEWLHAELASPVPEPTMTLPMLCSIRMIVVTVVCALTAIETTFQAWRVI